jgi:hypothetical protein
MKVILLLPCKESNGHRAGNGKRKVMLPRDKHSRYTAISLTSGSYPYSQGYIWDGTKWGRRVIREL